jgi:hypothetical protein
MTTSLPTIHSWDSYSSNQDYNLLRSLLITETISHLGVNEDIEPFNIQVIDHLVNLIREGKLTATKIGNHKINLMLIE